MNETTTFNTDDRVMLKPSKHWATFENYSADGEWCLIAFDDEFLGRRAAPVGELISEAQAYEEDTITIPLSAFDQLTEELDDQKCEAYAALNEDVMGILRETERQLKAAQEQRDMLVKALRPFAMSSDNREIAIFASAHAVYEAVTAEGQ